MSKNHRKSSRENRFSVNHQKSWLWGRHVVSDTLQSGRWPIIDFFVSHEASAEFSSLIALAKSRGIAHEIVSSTRLEELAHTSHHQGLIARMGQFPYQSASDLSDVLVQWGQEIRQSDASAEMVASLAPVRANPALVVLCDRVQDAFNFGAVLRSCDATRVAAVVIGSHEQVGVTSQVARSSAGAVNHVPIHRADDLLASVRQLRAHGLQIVAACEKVQQPLWQADLRKPTALLIGSESHGLKSELLDACDLHVRIPMLGSGQSLNAAVAAGIVMYEIRRQQHAYRSASPP